MTLHAVLRVDASPRIGTGHLARCLTLARALAREGCRVTVASRAPSEHTAAWVAREGHALRPLDDGDERALCIAATKDANLVVLDGYDFDTDLLAHLGANRRTLAVFDDLGDRALPVAAVIDGNFYGETLDYAHLAPTALHLLGPRHAVVREEFLEGRNARAQREARAADVPPRLLVTMGGADPTHETEKALDALDLLAARDVRLRATLVVGGANPRRDALVARARSSGPNIDVVADITTMGALMAEADLVLTAAGSTCLEIACVGVPLVTVVVADNQRGVGAALTARGIGRVLGESPVVTAGVMADAVDELLAPVSVDLCHAMVQAQHAAVDGLGAGRVARALTRLASPGYPPRG